MAIFSSWRVHFPKGMRTVKDLVRTLLAYNSEKFVADKQGRTAADVEIPLDDRSVDVWRQLQEILSAALGVEAEKIALESRLMGDLGAN